MLDSRVERGGRGLVRGLCFVALLAGCDKSSPPKPDAGPAADAAPPTAPVVDAAGDVADEPDLPPPPPPELTPPWTTLAPSFTELQQQVKEAQIGKMSGEAWGTDAPVRAVALAQCGAGALIQAVFDGPKGLSVTPAMPLRFIGVGTKNEVAYSEGAFNVKMHFTEHTPERLAGRLNITYDEHGQEKTFIDLTVDGKPIPMLLEPKLAGEGNLPEFPNCHPSGRFYARTADGRTATGFVNATLTDANKVLINALMSGQTGLRIAVLVQGPVAEPYTFDISKDDPLAPVRVVAGAYYVPELTNPDEAQGANLGSHQELTAREGVATVVWSKAKTPEISVRFENLRIPELIEGPLRGTTFAEFRVEAVAFPQGTYPKPPPSEPLAPAPKE